MNRVQCRRLSPTAVAVCIAGMVLYIVTAAAFVEFSINAIAGSKYIEALVYAAVPIVGAGWVAQTLRQTRRTGLSTTDVVAGVGKTLLLIGVAQFGLGSLLAGFSVP